MTRHLSTSIQRGRIPFDPKIDFRVKLLRAFFNCPLIKCHLKIVCQSWAITKWKSIRFRLLVTHYSSLWVLCQANAGRKMNFFLPTLCVKRSDRRFSPAHESSISDRTGNRGRFFLSKIPFPIMRNVHAHAEWSNGLVKPCAFRRKTSKSESARALSFAHHRKLAFSIWLFLGFVPSPQMCANARAFIAKIAILAKKKGGSLIIFWVN